MSLGNFRGIVREVQSPRGSRAALRVPDAALCLAPSDGPDRADHGAPLPAKADPGSACARVGMTSSLRDVQPLKTFRPTPVHALWGLEPRGSREGVQLAPLSIMLPRKSSPAPRRNTAVSVEVRVPSLGTAFGAIAANVGPDGVFLSTFHALAVGTAVIATLSLPDGPVIADGVVIDAGDAAGQGIALALEGIDDAVRDRLRAA